MNVCHCTADAWNHQRKERRNIRRHTFTCVQNDLQQLTSFTADLSVVVNKQRSSSVQQFTNMCHHCHRWAAVCYYTAQLDNWLETKARRPMTAMPHQFLHTHSTIAQRNTLVTIQYNKWLV